MSEVAKYFFLELSKFYVHFVIVFQIFRQLDLLFSICWNSCLLFKLRFTVFGGIWC